MPRSVFLHPDHKETAQLALEREGFLTQGDLAANLGIALSTVSIFFNCKPISIRKFEEICETLNLDKRAITQPIQAKPQIFVPILYDADTWVGRESIVNELLPKLQEQTCLLWITGISGIGKTTLGECLASQAWESDPSFQWIYLEILEGQSPDFASVAAELLAKLGDRDLDPQERNNPEQLAKRLLQKLQSRRYWIQLDSMERLLNPEQPTEFVDVYWATFLQRCLTESNVVSRLVLTAQAFPTALIEFNDRYPNVWAEHRLGGLLQVEQQLEFFAKRGLAVESANRDILTRIAKIYEGHPLVLKVIAEDIVNGFAGDVNRYWQAYQPEFEQVARELQATRLNETEYTEDNEALDRKVRERIKKSLEQLPRDALDLLCRSAVFRRPVPKTFWLATIGDLSPQQRKAAYRVLDDHALIEKESTEIRQHNLICSVAYDLLKADTPTWEAAERQAAHLWLTAYQPAPDAPNLETVRGYLEAFNHYCEIEDWEEAVKTLATKNVPIQEYSLYMWLNMCGYYQEQITLQSRIFGKNPFPLEGAYLICLAKSYNCMGNFSAAIACCQEYLHTQPSIRDSKEEMDVLRTLGDSYRLTNNYQLALENYQKSLTLAREYGSTIEILGSLIGMMQIGKRILFEMRKVETLFDTQESTTVKPLYQVLESIQNDVSQALGTIKENWQEHLDEESFDVPSKDVSSEIDLIVNHLEITDQFGSLSGRMNAHRWLAIFYAKQGSNSTAKQSLLTALELSEKTRSRVEEADILKHLAELHQALGEVEEARPYCQQALALAIELEIPLAAECQNLLEELEKKKGESNEV